ncbi:MAG: transposase, partial [Acidobacteriota bacterium]
QVAERNGLALYAWALLGNHYHLVVRMGPAPLSHSMKSLQQLVTRARNRTANVFGPMWQGRFKAKQVNDHSYLSQLIAYVHLNPVKAGIVTRPKKYRWSGPRDVLGLRKKPLVAVDDVLAIYGSSRRQALGAYRSALRSVGESDWSGEGPGHLPWWRLGRPRLEEDLRPIGHVMADELGRPNSPYRSVFEADDWIERTCRHLGVQREDLASRSRKEEIVRVRELIGLLGVERYGVKVKALAASLGKSEDGVSLWVRRGARRRLENKGFAEDAEALDAALREDR